MDIEVRTLANPIEHFDEVVHLLRANWEESAIPVPFIADDALKFYSYMAQINAFHAAVAYQGDEAIGYAIATIAPHPLNHSYKVMSVDGIYLKPELRKGRTGSELMEAIRAVAKKHECVSINWHAPTGSDFSRTLEARYLPLNTYYMEVLKYE